MLLFIHFFLGEAKSLLGTHIPNYVVNWNLDPKNYYTLVIMFPFLFLSSPAAFSTPLSSKLG